MKPTKVIQIAWRGLNRNRLRSLLTMLGLIIGVAAVIIMISVSTGTETTIKEQIEGLGTNLVFVQSSFTRGGPGEQSSNGLVYDDAAAIANGVTGVTGTSVEQNASGTVKFGKVSVDSVSILGTTEDFPQVRGVSVASGRYITQTDLDRKQKIAVLGAALAEELFWARSSTLPMSN
jgi:putative ABC transport system permease protein